MAIDTSIATVRWPRICAAAITLISIALVALMPVDTPAGSIAMPLILFVPIAVLLVAALASVVLLGYRAACPPGNVRGTLEDPAIGLVAPFRTGDSDDEAMLRREQMRHVFTQIYLLMALNIANALLMIGAIAASAPPLLLTGWAVAILVLTFVVILARYRGRNRPADRPVSKRAIRRVTLHSGIRGLLWGLAIVLFFADAGPTDQLILASICAGMLAGGTLALAPIPSAALAYGFAMMVPSVLRFVAMGTLDYALLACFALSFSGSLALICAHFYKSFAGQLIARRAASEQAETISLLLNEYEKTASDWLWECDSECRLTRMPARMRELLGAHAGLEVPLPFDDALALVREADRNDLRARLTAESRAPFRGVLVACAREGSELVWIEISASPRADGGWRGVGSDRTTEIRARQETAAALDRAEHAEMRLKDGINSLDSALVLTGTDDRIIITNRRFGELFPAAELMGPNASFEAILHAQATRWFHAAPDRGAAWTAAILAKRQSAIGVHDAELPDARWLRIVARPTSDGGVITVFTEITDIKLQEQRLARQSEQLERSNGELGRFAYSASHDLQEPLRKIEAFAGRLKTRAGDALDADSRLFVDRISAATGRMRRLITDLLEYSRIARAQVVHKPVNLAAVVAGVTDDLSVSIEETGARIEATGLGVIRGDETLMRQLVQNLLTNALKFRRQDVAPVIMIKQTSPAEGIDEIRFADNGIGFDMKHHDRIFEAFQRLHGKNEFEGSGIGLATCARIVACHNGSIRAESTPGQGATFIITLGPYKRPVAEAA